MSNYNDPLKGSISQNNFTNNTDSNNYDHFKKTLYKTLDLVKNYASSPTSRHNSNFSSMNILEYKGYKPNFTPVNNTRSPLSSIFNFDNF